MPNQSLDRLLSELEEHRYRFGRDAARRVVSLLKSLEAEHFPDALSLIRFHECLLFLRAFPQAPIVVRKTEQLMNSFFKKVNVLRESGASMSDFDPLEVSGIAGTQMEDALSFDLARWLVRRMPSDVQIAWDDYDEGRAMGETWPRFLPLLEDDACVEADTPWQRWLETAQRGKKASPTWLIQRFEELPLAIQQKAELYDSLRLPLRWDLGNSRVSRTRNWRSVRRVFYHTEPLIQRSDVSLAEQLSQPPPQLQKLSRDEGRRIMDTIREVMLVRYRDLYGTTLGDPASVVRADMGRGISIHLWNLLPERRLPLRAYVAGFTLKNGVPINYIEAIGLFEWIEVGFNTFYTFRGGEAGWIYAQVLRCLCSLMGVTCISVYPYQLGHDNEEAIESGAFWFYRKLGFRPGRPELKRLVEREEKKIAADRKLCGAGALARQSPYRTPPRILRRLAAGHVFYELPGSEISAWDKFSTRNIGLRVNRRMAREFGGDARRFRDHATRALERILGASTSSWPRLEKAAFDNFALVLGEVPDLRAWTKEEKEGLLRLIRAKAKPNEMLYLHLTQQHGRLRKALLRLGSSR